MPETAGFFSKLQSLVGNFVNDLFIPVLFAIALLVFAYGIFNYFILGPAEEDIKEQGRKQLLWGNVLLIGAISVWGVVQGISWVANLDLDIGGNIRETEEVLPIPNVLFKNE